MADKKPNRVFFFWSHFECDGLGCYGGGVCDLRRNSSGGPPPAFPWARITATEDRHKIGI